MRSRTTTVFKLKARSLVTSDTEALRISASALRTTLRVRGVRIPRPPPLRSDCCEGSDQQMIARIYKPARTAMQSGEARTKEWVLEFAPASPREIDPLMGWTSSRDMKAEVELAFDTKEEAIAYAEREGLAYQVFEPLPRRQIRKSYADNFKFGRIGRWTH